MSTLSINYTWCGGVGMVFRVKRPNFVNPHRCETRVFLNGGLGNQLFQLAFGIEISKSRNSTLYLDTEYLENDTKRNYALDLFSFSPNQSLDPTNLDSLASLQNKECECEEVELRETNFHFTDFSDAYSKIGRIGLHGYWQSHLYFEKSAEFVRDVLTRCLPAQIDLNYGVMHIRRGDFLKDPRTREFHGILGVQYYVKASNLIPGDIKKVFVVSDDIKEAQLIALEVSRIFPQIAFELFEDSADEMASLSLMANAKLVITANSSFSWWGSFLGKPKMVIAPRDYFSAKILRMNNTADLYPREWYLL